MEGNRDNGNHQFSQPNLPHIGTSKTSGVSLNVHLTVPPTTTAAQDGSHTPNTPEILNSIVKLQAEREEAREAFASSGPFGAEFARQCAIRSTPIPTMSLPNELSSEEPVTVKPISSGYNQIEPPTINVIPPMSSPAGSSVTSESTLISPVSSPATTPGSGPGTIQHLTSQFIKAGLKMKVTQKLGDSGTLPAKSRRSSSTKTAVHAVESKLDNKNTLSPMESFSPGASKLSPVPLLSPTDSEEAYPIDVNSIKREELTSDDTQRRLRRRERNKIAATKCRNKKKARTQILIRESETLTVQNQSLKNEIHKLEQEKSRLMQVLSGHDSACLQRMQQESVEIKRENFPSPMDDNEFRVPATMNIDPTISNPPGLNTTSSNFTLPPSSYTDRTALMAQPLLTSNSPMTNDPNLLSFNISQANQLDLHHQPLMTSGHEMITTVSPSECHPPSFDDAVSVASEVKMEDSSQDTDVQIPNIHRQPLQQGFTPIFESNSSIQQMNEPHHDAFRGATFGNHGIGDASNYFLAKRPLGHTYLDLDNRCIAL